MNELNMIIRWMKISVALLLSLILTISLTKLVICLWENFHFVNAERFDVELWLEQNQLDQYKETFRKRGKLKYLFYVLNYLFGVNSLSQYILTSR